MSNLLFRFSQISKIIKEQECEDMFRLFFNISVIPLFGLANQPTYNQPIDTKKILLHSSLPRVIDFFLPNHAAGQHILTNQRAPIKSRTNQDPEFSVFLPTNTKHQSSLLLVKKEREEKVWKKDYFHVEWEENHEISVLKVINYKNKIWKCQLQIKCDRC